MTTSPPLPPEVIHRIIYQSSVSIATACGIVWPGTRDEITARSDLTIWRGRQTCPACPDELNDLPEVVRMLIGPKNEPLDSVTMIDLPEFGRRFTDKLLTISAENQGIGRLETVRRYHTDPKYKGTVDAIVMGALQTLQDMENQPMNERSKYLEEVFGDEANGLLGWDRD